MDNAQKNINRQSNIELLRIILIILIVLHHICIHAGFSFERGVEYPKIIIQLLGVGGKIGVDCFILISGFFMANSKKSVVEKTVKIWMEVLIYSVIFLVITFVMGRTELISRENLLYSLFPITTRHYWFISTYLVMLIFTPWINAMIANCDKTLIKQFIIVGGVLWIAIPTITNKNMESNELILFVFLYIVGAYIGMYGIGYKLSRLVIILIGLILLTFLSTIVIDYMEVSYSGLQPYELYFYAPQRLNIVIISVVILLLFLRIKIGFNKHINSIANHVFGIYLFHENVFNRTYLWRDIFRISTFGDKSYLPLYLFFVVIVVIAVAILLDFFRLKLMEPIYMGLIRKILRRDFKL